MDENVKRAEELLAQRMRSQRTNGHPAVDDALDGTSLGEGPPDTSRRDTDTQDAAALTHDLQRLAADFANYRKRTDAERSEFAKYAKA
ncbi:MAG: hypothetical protein M3Q61_02090, partial [Chloroflexota bacterium]|nr:hypothetical protein [Chloroflexota bacterium]